MELVEIAGELWISRLDAGARTADQPDSEFFSVTRTANEVSVVGSAPVDGARVEGPWRAFRVAGVLDFSLTGVLHELTRPLADDAISVFTLSTFDTDYFLVRTDRAAAAVKAWTAAGYRVVDAPA